MVGGEDPSLHFFFFKESLRLPMGPARSDPQHHHGRMMQDPGTQRRVLVSCCLGSGVRKPRFQGSASCHLHSVRPWASDFTSRGHRCRLRVPALTGLLQTVRDNILHVNMDAVRTDLGKRLMSITQISIHGRMMDGRHVVYPYGRTIQP